MFKDILVATDRHDTAEESVRYRTSRERRFLARLVGLVLDLAFPSGGAPFEIDGESGTIEFHADHATRHAIDMARHHGARLHVLFTIDAVRYDTTVEFATEPLVEEGEATLEGLVDEAEHAGLDVTETVEIGRPASLILDYAARHSVDLIVLNARQTGRVRSRVLGTLESSVIRRSSVPVYVVPRIQPGHPD